MGFSWSKNNHFIDDDRPDYYYYYYYYYYINYNNNKTPKATMYVEVGETTYPVNMESVVMEGREGSEGQSHKEEKREGGDGTGREPLAREGGLCLHIRI